MLSIRVSPTTSVPRRVAPVPRSRIPCRRLLKRLYLTPIRRTCCRPLTSTPTDWDDVEVFEEASEDNWEPIDLLTEEELREELDLFEVRLKDRRFVTDPVRCVSTIPGPSTICRRSLLWASAC